jgi:hypothetical protein
MAGAVAIIVFMLLIPVAVFVGGAVLSAVMGQSLTRDAEHRHEGSELLELSD